MSDSIEENELMKLCSEGGTVKIKAKFCVRNTNQKYRKDSSQRTSIKQKQ